MTTLIPKYYQGAAGSVNRPINLKFAETVSVLDFGADSTGAIDSTDAMQAAHNTGKLVYYPAGSYKFTSITLADGGIIGDGPSLTILFQNSATLNGIVYTPGASVGLGPLFRNFQIQSGIEKTNGALLVVNAFNSSSQIFGTTIDNVWLYQLYYDGLVMTNQTYYSVTNCHFVNYSNIGFTQVNSLTDSGDSSISGCLFNTARSTGSLTGYSQNSGGGIRITNNKFLGGRYNINVFLTQNTASADLFILGNSLELATAAAIRFARNTGATGSLGPILIEGNNLGSLYSIIVETQNAFSIMTIANNSFYQIPTSSNGIYLAGVAGVNISGNTFDAPAGTTGLRSIYLDSVCTKAQIKNNLYIRQSLPIASDTTNVIINESNQYGSATATTSATYGSFYAATLNIVFPVAFYAAPTVTATLNNVSALGGVSVVVGSVTTLGFNATVIGITTGQALPFNWSASGIVSY